MESRESFPQTPEDNNKEESTGDDPETREGDETKNSDEAPEFNPEKIDIDKLREAIKRAKKEK